MILSGFFFLILASSGYSQNQKIADSLRHIYQRKNVHDTIRLGMLRKLAFNEVNDFNLALSYADELIELATRLNNGRYLFVGYYQKGNKHKILGNLDQAMGAYLKSLDAAEAAGFKKSQGSAYGAIADIYSTTGNHTNAVMYHKKAIAILREAADSIPLASAILNAGDAYYNHQDYDTALLYFEESGKIFDQIDYAIGKAYNLGNIGMVYASLGDNQLAEKYMNNAMTVLEDHEDYYPICFYLMAISDIYRDKGNITIALKYANEALKIAKAHELKKQVSDASEKLAHLYDNIGDVKKSYHHFKNYIAFRDSVKNVETVQKIANLRTEFEIAQKQAEVDLLNQERKTQQIIQYGSLLIFVIVAGGLSFSVWQKIRNNRKLRELNDSKDKLFSIIGHDLRGPLNSLSGFSSLLLKQGDTFTKEEMEMILSDLDKSLKNLFKLLENLLDWARSQTGNFDFKKEEFDLNKMLESNRELLHGQAQSKNISLVYDGSRELPVLANSNSINTVIRNLISNAIKFTMDEGMIVLGVEEKGQHFMVSVKDTGLGMSEKVIEKLFKVGTKHSTLGTAQEKGTGLGLVLCKDFVEKNGGKIWVTSTEGKGSKFCFTVPKAA